MELKLRAVRLMLEIGAWPARRRFEQALRDPTTAQKKLRRELLDLTGRAALPPRATSWSDYAEGRSWTREPVLFFEHTSGSGDRKKAIPYTHSLRSSFGRMFLIWATDVLRHGGLRSGRSFISISPKLQCLGLETDLEYLHPLLAFLLQRFLITRPEDQVAVDGEAFQKRMRERLLAARDLEIISVWSPTYLLSLLEGMDVDPALHWPQLRLISVWGDAGAAPGFTKLQRLFPQARIQKKGLLATEAPMTIPLFEAAGAVPLWNEVLMEILGRDGRIRPLTALKEGEDGELLISTRGGLLRYRIGDRVRVSGHYLASPLIEFVGRKGLISDLAGEKFTEEIVVQLLGKMPGAWSLHAEDRGYLLLTQHPVDPSWAEEKLRGQHHYALARELGQLRALRTETEPDLDSLHLEFGESRGQKRGDIKAKLLWAAPEFLHWRRSRSVPPSRKVAAAPNRVGPDLQV